ncbi:MAG: ABC transporter ATP-binding protein [Oscillospiraceae bacterium]
MSATNGHNNDLLTINNLSVEYHAGGEIVQAVNNVSFSIKAGETLGLVGETGAGKTTIGKSIMSILPDPPAKVKSGEIIFKGNDILKMSEKDVRKIRGKSIAMIFQDPMTALNPMFTVGKQISEVIKIHELLNTHEAKEKAIEMLELVGIPGDRYDEYPHQFSGGMKQRVVIAMALACNPELLIADEPTTALDVTIQAQVLELMAGLKSKFNTSMILITHDLGIVAHMCDRVAIVYAGEVIEIGTCEDIFDRTAHPYTKGLFGALPSIAMENERLKPIKGNVPDPANLPKGCKFHPRCPNATPECSKAENNFYELTPGHFTNCIYAKKEIAHGQRD